MNDTELASVTELVLPEELCVGTGVGPELDENGVPTEEDELATEGVAAAEEEEPECDGYAPEEIGADEEYRPGPSEREDEGLAGLDTAGEEAEDAGTASVLVLEGAADEGTEGLYGADDPG